MKRTAALLVVALAVTLPAHAEISRLNDGPSVSEQVGPLLKEAHSLAADGYFSRAMAKLHEAEAASVSQYDVTMIHAVKQSIDFKIAQTTAPR